VSKYPGIRHGIAVAVAATGLVSFSALNSFGTASAMEHNHSSTTRITKKTTSSNKSRRGGVQLVHAGTAGSTSIPDGRTPLDHYPSLRTVHPDGSYNEAVVVATDKTLGGHPQEAARYGTPYLRGPGSLSETITRAVGFRPRNQREPLFFGGIPVNDLEVQLSERLPHEGDRGILRLVKNNDVDGVIQDPEAEFVNVIRTGDSIRLIDGKHQWADLQRTERASLLPTFLSGS